MNHKKKVWLKKTRLNLNMSQAELAKELNFTAQQVSNMETGKADIKKTTELAVKFLEISKESELKKSIVINEMLSILHQSDEVMSDELLHSYKEEGRA